MTAPRARAGRADARISALEWIVAGVGLLLVAGALAFVLVDAAREDGGPPRLTVRADSVLALGDAGFVVQFTAENRGRATAADVGIVGELRGASAESARASLDYVPGRSERRGGLVFRGDPRAAGLRLRVEGYREP